MITKITHCTVFVLNQESAYEFYTEKLGMEVRTDAKMGDFRWLTVGPKGQPDMELVLMPISDKMFGGQPEAADSLRTLVEKGLMSGPVLECDDLIATYEEMKSKGVEFTKPPTKEFYKFEAVFKDDSGNWFSLGEKAG